MREMGWPPRPLCDEGAFLQCVREPEGRQGAARGMGHLHGQEKARVLEEMLGTISVNYIYSGR